MPYSRGPHSRPFAESSHSPSRSPSPSSLASTSRSPSPGLKDTNIRLDEHHMIALVKTHTTKDTDAWMPLVRTWWKQAKESSDYPTESLLDDGRELNAMIMSIVTDKHARTQLRGMGADRKLGMSCVDVVGWFGMMVKSKAFLQAVRQLASACDRRADVERRLVLAQRLRHDGHIYVRGKPPSIEWSTKDVELAKDRGQLEDLCRQAGWTAEAAELEACRQRDEEQEKEHEEHEDQVQGQEQNQEQNQEQIQEQNQEPTQEQNHQHNQQQSQHRDQEHEISEDEERGGDVEHDELHRNTSRVTSRGVAQTARHGQNSETERHPSDLENEDFGDVSDCSTDEDSHPGHNSGLCGDIGTDPTPERGREAPSPLDDSISTFQFPADDHINANITTPIRGRSAHSRLHVNTSTSVPVSPSLAATRRLLWPGTNLGAPPTESLDCFPRPVKSSSRRRHLSDSPFVFHQLSRKTMASSSSASHVNQTSTADFSQAHDGCAASALINAGEGQRENPIAMSSHRPAKRIRCDSRAVFDQLLASPFTAASHIVVSNTIQESRATLLQELEDARESRDGGIAVFLPYECPDFADGENAESSQRWLTICSNPSAEQCPDSLTLQCRHNRCKERAVRQYEEIFSHGAKSGGVLTWHANTDNVRGCDASTLPALAAAVAALRCLSSKQNKVPAKFHVEIWCRVLATFIQVDSSGSDLSEALDGMITRASNDRPEETATQKCSGSSSTDQGRDAALTPSTFEGLYFSLIDAKDRLRQTLTSTQGLRAELEYLQHVLVKWLRSPELDTPTREGHQKSVVSLSEVVKNMEREVQSGLYEDVLPGLRSKLAQAEKKLAASSKSSLILAVLPEVALCVKECKSRETRYQELVSQMQQSHEAFLTQWDQMKI